MSQRSPEMREQGGCGFNFAEAALRQGYDRFEAVLTPVMALGLGPITPERTAHVLASATRGFKQTATSPEALRQLIDALLSLSLACGTAVSPP